MGQWEYKVIDFKTGAWGSISDKVERCINEFASEGWEYVNSHWDPNGLWIMIIFKRKKER